MLILILRGKIMLKKTYVLWEKEEYSYPLAKDFIPSVHACIHDEDDAARPAFIVVPGGAYRKVSPSEGEIAALKFFDMGYNTFVVTYTTNLTGEAPLKLQPLKDLSKAVCTVRLNASDLRIDPKKVIVCGFSAGGHLAGTLAVHSDLPESRPDAVILCYPVITTGKYAHEESIRMLLGDDPSAEELEYMSLEKNVTKDTPPAFLWQTATDEIVPVRNSYLFAEACLDAGVPFEHHVFAEGIHGLSVADKDWADISYGGDYTLEQTMEVLQSMADAGIPLPDDYRALGPVPRGTDLRELGGPMFKQIIQPREPAPDVAVWVQMADRWIRKTLG